MIQAQFNTHQCGIKRSKQAGFSLVELMIAGSIGIFLLTAVIQVFSQSGQTVSINQSINEIQDRGRSLLHHLSYQMKQKGYQGCLPPLAINIQQIDNIDWDNVQMVIPSANNLPEVAYTRTALRAFEINAAGTWSPQPQQQDIIKVQNASYGVTPRPGSDVIHIEYGHRRSVNLSSNMADIYADIQIPTGTIDVAVGDTLMIGDCTIADIITVTNVSYGAGTIIIEHKLNNNRLAALNKPYATDAQVRHFVSSTYFVADTGRQTVNSIDIYGIYRVDINENLVELADGVDFLQATYTMETDAGIQSVSANSPAFDPLKVTGVDIGVLVVGLKKVLSNTDTKTYRLPGQTIGPDESFQYQPSFYLKNTFNTFIDLKNRS